MTTDADRLAQVQRYADAQLEVVRAQQEASEALVRVIEHVPPGHIVAGLRAEGQPGGRS